MFCSFVQLHWLWCNGLLLFAPIHPIHFNKFSFSLISIIVDIFCLNMIWTHCNVCWNLVLNPLKTSSGLSGHGNCLEATETSFSSKYRRLNDRPWYCLVGKNRGLRLKGWKTVKTGEQESWAGLASRSGSRFSESVLKLERLKRARSSIDLPSWCEQWIKKNDAGPARPILFHAADISVQMVFLSQRHLKAHQLVIVWSNTPIKIAVRKNG